MLKLFKELRLKKSLLRSLIMKSNYKMKCQKIRLMNSLNCIKKLLNITLLLAIKNLTSIWKKSENYWLMKLFWMYFRENRLPRKMKSNRWRIKKLENLRTWKSGPVDPLEDLILIRRIQQWKIIKKMKKICLKILI